MIILNENEIMDKITISEAINVMRNAFYDKYEKNLVSPPRYNIGDDGKIVITQGANKKLNLSGFRCYNLYGETDDQFTTVINTATGAIKGIITGGYLGTLRTGAIGALSIDMLAKKNSTILSVIGSGNQALIQTLCALKVRDITEIRVFSPNKNHRKKFVETLKNNTDINIINCDNSTDAIVNTDIIITATTSTIPVINSDYINNGMHIVWVGNKHKDSSEIGDDVILKSNKIYTDSINQLNSYKNSHKLENFTPKKIIYELSDLIAGHAMGRENDNEITIFASVGLSGTEVMLANYILLKC
jgi:ornithine cyclodeaminase/alanine dehydrogenase-like protein (mu-crystallin family)